ncbi:MAG: glycoside hydrolase TIM-barrel-like domain-containing protein, partial [Rickettsiales bacterium]|nr:glycoside hydrolase TIM-barrel-like domain-containing protein [Rickettsiales bacterium]
MLLLPLFFMEVANKPWRGRVTGTATAVDNFFGKTNGYNAFITHYANLCAGRIDGFAIGSEMIGLTKVMGTPAGVFPAVNRLVTLAGTVRSILGGSVKLTYAADWSEYHHEANGWYNLDPLWASPNIDVIGIDGYFPLTDEPQSGITLEKIMAGWTSGEGYDWYYTDEARTQKAPLAPAYAWKNIGWFWSQPHVNPNGTTTAWVPASKKIWFTEYGFPSVDGATNQPNVFYDPSSSESFFPRFSRGQVDFRAQRLGIAATEAVWGSSSMVERRFLWTWDARPYPFY